MFSDRTAWPRESGAWAAAVERARSRPGLIDLTVSNPTTVGLSQDVDLVSRGVYRPDPFGAYAAREAIAEYYRARGRTIAAEQIIITATTSEAYAWLFRLLADPGDVIAAPRPSYPLISTLAQLSDVVVRPYDLAFDGHRFSYTPPGGDVRAIVAVSPNNPSGNALTADERRGLATAPLILDEVFLDSLAEPRSFAGLGDTLSFTLSGLSKVAGLPGAKLSWIVVGGPAEQMDEAIARLEIISDAFLSVSQSIQAALPELLARAPDFARGTRERILANRSKLGELGELVDADGGWCAIVRTDAPDDERYAIELLEEHGVLVQPGYLFDLPFEGGLVVSTIVREETMAKAVTKISLRRRGASGDRGW